MRKTIKEFRLEKGWTQKELGEKFRKKKAPEIISRWENNNAVPSSLSLMELSQIFNVNMNDVLIDYSIKKEGELCPTNSRHLRQSKSS